MRFTSDSQNLNKPERGCELERDEIDQQWTRLIQGLHPADDPKSYELLAQVDHQHEMKKHGIASLMHVLKVEYPMYDEYWEKRADRKAFFEREHQFELFGFQKKKSRYNLSRAQERNWPGCILMEDGGREGSPSAKDFASRSTASQVPGFGEKCSASESPQGNFQICNARALGCGSHKDLSF